VVVGYIVRLGRDYAVAVGALVALGIVTLPIAWIASLIVRSPIPILPGLFAAAILTYPPLVMSRVLGLLVRLRGDSLGFSSAEDTAEPVLPGVTPHGKAHGLGPAA